VIEIVVNVLLGLLLRRLLGHLLLLLLGIHLRMVVAVVVVAMHVVRIVVTRMHARRRWDSDSPTTSAMKAVPAVPHHQIRVHVAIRDKDIHKEGEHEQDVEQADEDHHKLLATAAVVEHSLLYNRLFHIVGGQHAGLAGALHPPGHPAGIDGLHLKDDVALAEADLVDVLRLVVVDGPVDALKNGLQMGITMRKIAFGLALLTNAVLCRDCFSCREE